jgi:hypothetical protein
MLKLKLNESGRKSPSAPLKKLIVEPEHGGFAV